MEKIKRWWRLFLKQVWIWMLNNFKLSKAKCGHRTRLAEEFELWENRNKRVIKKVYLDKNNLDYCFDCIRFAPKVRCALCGATILLNEKSTLFKPGQRWIEPPYAKRDKNNPEMYVICTRPSCFSKSIKSDKIDRVYNKKKIIER